MFPLSPLPGSIAPATAGPWYRYDFSLTLRNDTRTPVTLTPETLLRLGAPDPHAFEAPLAAPTTIPPGQAVALQFARRRICGFLAPATYPATLVLVGHTAEGQPITEDITDPANAVTITPAAQEPNTSMQVATGWSFVIPRGEPHARNVLLIRTHDIYPDDVTVEWTDGPASFDVLLDDLSPFPNPLVLPDVIGSLDLTLNYRPRPGLASDTPYRIGQLICRRPGVSCPHEGLPIGVGAGGVIRGTITEDANLRPLAATPESRSAPRGTPLHLNVCLVNDKPYDPTFYPILIPRPNGLAPSAPRRAWQVEWNGRDPSIVLVVEDASRAVAPDDASSPTPTTSVLAESGGQDVSDKFTLLDITGASLVRPGTPAIVTLVLLPHPDAPLGPCRLTPRIATLLYADGPDGHWTPVPGLADASLPDPPIVADIDIVE